MNNLYYFLSVLLLFGAILIIIFIPINHVEGIQELPIVMNGNVILSSNTHVMSQFE